MLTKRQEAVLDVAEVKMLRFSPGVTNMTGLEVSTSEGHLRSRSLETTLERRG